MKLISSMTFLMVFLIGDLTFSQSTPNPIVDFYKGELPRNQPADFRLIYQAKGTEYLIINHSSSEFDSDLSTATAVRRLQNEVLAQPKIRTIALTNKISIEPDGKYKTDFTLSKSFFDPKYVDHAMFSPTGSHNIIFPKVKKITFAGGYLEYCLCEAMRDVMAGVLFGTKPKELEFRTVDFVLVPEAIYSEGWGSPAATRSTSDGSLPLAYFLSVLSDDELMDFLSNTLFPESRNGFCLQQSRGSVVFPGPTIAKPSRQNVTIRVFRSGFPIGRIGSGAATFNLYM